MTTAVLPLKSFGRAKSRLGDFPDRSGLAAAMAADVITALHRVRGLDEILVVTRGDMGSDSFPPGLFHVPDPAEAGHVPAALLGIDVAVERGATRVLLVPGDCPALDPGEVEELLAAEAAVVIVPDRHGTGTNALLLEPPGVIRPSFGPGSFARHAALARAAGVPWTVARPPSLLLDVDTPQDLDALLGALRPGAAMRTRALLQPVP